MPVVDNERISFSQLCAKASVPYICSIRIKANKAKQFIGVSFDLNDTVVKIGSVFNTRRNSRLRDKGALLKDGLLGTPTIREFQVI
jgi:hypothetical protein